MTLLWAHQLFGGLVAEYSTATRCPEMVADRRDTHLAAVSICKDKSSLNKSTGSDTFSNLPGHVEYMVFRLS